MILLDVRDYLKERKWVNLKSLSEHFHQDPDTMRHLLMHWLHKGVLFRAPSPEGCGLGCSQCDPAISEVYCWRDVMIVPPPSCSQS